MILPLVIPLILLFAITVNSQTDIKAVRIGYFESGPYYMHKLMMNDLHRYLENMSGESFRIIFEPFAFRSAEWNRNICRAMAGDLARMKNIDLVIAAGPWVIEDLLEADFDRPILGIYQYEPELRGLVDSTGRPTAKNLTLTYYPDKIISDLSAMKDVFNRERVGFLYFPSGHEFDSVAVKAEEIGRQLGMEILPSESYSPDGRFSFFLALDKIRGEIDALYVMPLWGMDLEMLREFFVQVHFDNIATFTSDGFAIVEKGAVAANCGRAYQSEALFTADKIKKIINGAVAADLPTRLDEVRTLCLNLEEADNIGLTLARRNLLRARIVPSTPGDAVPRLNISQAIEQAVTENADLHAIEQVYGQAVAEAKKAHAANYYPRLSLRAGAAETDIANDASLYNRFLNREYFADVIVDQNIFSYPAIKAIDIARKNREINKVDLEKAQFDLRHTVTVAYLSVLRDEDKVSACLEIADRLREYRETATVNYVMGKTDTLDITRINQRLTDAIIKLADARNELRVSRTILNILLNRPADYEYVLHREEFDDDIMVATVRELEYYISDAGRQKKLEQFFVEFGIDNSLEMNKADLSVGLHRDLISQNKAWYFPNISLRAKYSYSNDFNTFDDGWHDNWTIGGIINFPIAFGGQRQQQGKILKGRLDEILYKKDALRLELMGEILTVSDNLFTRMVTLPMQYDSRNTAKNNLALMEDNYRSGRGSFEELSRLEKILADKEMTLLDDRFGFFNAYAELFHTLGLSYLTYGSPGEAEFHQKIVEHFSN